MSAQRDMPRPSRRQILAASATAAVVSLPAPAAAATAGPRPALTAFPLADVRLLEGPFLANMRRTCAYLLLVDAGGLLHTFRLNVDFPVDYALSSADSTTGP